MYFEEVHVLPKYPHSLFVQWRLDNSSLPENYFFDIYLSDNPRFGFTKITDSPLVNTFFYDIPFSILTKGEYSWCKIEATIGDAKIESEPQGLFYNLDRRRFLTVKEIIRKKELNRRKNTGIYCAVFKRITFGPPCPECIEIHTGSHTNSKCLSCYGTGKFGGYYDPIYNWMELVEGDKDLKPSEIGVTENNSAMFFITYPILQKRDIVVEIERNRRWFVNEIPKRQALQTVPVDQIVQLRMIAPKDVEYRLEVDIKNENVS